jgi:aerobic-type carbon monoxide dehydrogenase small subunit (CoxS/CutS family)
LAEKWGIGLYDAVIRLTVNNESFEIGVFSNWTLQFVLHDKLGLLGAKDFCSAGECGACTVIMDGRPVLSCMMLAIECDGSSIETVEGIARADHPLIDAYVDNSCMQCGYCTPGFVTAAKALLDRCPSPTEDQVKEALSGNLCRCGTYPQHVKAVLQASEKMKKGLEEGS